MNRREIHFLVYLFADYFVVTWDIYAVRRGRPYKMCGVEKNPLAVRRPGRMNILGFTLGKLANVCSITINHEDWGTAFASRHKCDQLAVRRPSRCIVFLGASRKLTHVASVVNTVGIDHVHLHPAVST